MREHPPGEVVRRLVQLQRIPLFAELPPAVLAGVAERARETQVRAGDVMPSGLPSTIRFFPAGGVTTGSNAAALAFTPELVHWLAEADGAATHVIAEGACIEVGTTQLSAALDDEFALYLAIARALATELVAGRAVALRPAAAVDAASVLRARTHYDLFERAVLLRAMVPFAHTHVGALVHLARHAVELHVDRAHELWRKGDASDHALFVVHGTVRALGAGQADATLGPGCVLGAFDALARAPRSSTAIAEEPVTALVLPAERFFDVLEDRHELARDLLRELARTLLSAWIGEPLVAAPSSPYRWPCCHEDERRRA